jgi:membrane protease subunit HflC
VRDQISSTDLLEIVRSKDWKVSEEDLARAQAVSETDEEILRQRVASGREELTKTILAKAREQMPTLGIELVDIRIKRVDYVESVQQRVFERMIAERQRIAEQFRSEGQGRAAQIDGETERLLAQVRSEAQRRGEIIRGEADAEATRIYNEAFGADPEFFAFFRSLESYSRSIGAKTTIFLGPDSDYVRYLRKSGLPPE